VGPEDCDEPSWIDLVNENLEHGRMTLLIVGDGIRSETRQLAEAVSGHPDFQFRLGLVELRLYWLADDRVVVVPTLLARTQEIPRAIVRIEGRTEQGPRVLVETPTDGGRKPGPSVLTEEAFLAELQRGSPGGDANAAVARRLLGMLQEAGFTIDWQRASFSVRLPDPSGSGVMFSLAYGYKNGHFGCWSSCPGMQLSKVFGDGDAAERIHESHADRLRALGAVGKADLGVEMASLAGREQEVLDWLEKTASMIRQEARSLPPQPE